MPKPRSVPLCKVAETIVERQVMSHPNTSFIFLHEDGTPYTRYTLRDRFRRLSKACGLKTVVPYGLRHTFASLQAAGGTETTSLAQLMGHSSVRTLQRYVANTAKEHKEAMDRNEERLMGMLGGADKTDGQDPYRRGMSMAKPQLMQRGGSRKQQKCATKCATEESR